MNKGDRVRLINPNGYNDYQGTLVAVAFGIGVDDFWIIKWDLPGHPCTSPMEEKYLELVDKERIMI